MSAHRDPSLFDEQPSDATATLDERMYAFLEHCGGATVTELEEVFPTFTVRQLNQARHRLMGANRCVSAGTRAHGRQIVWRIA